MMSDRFFTDLGLPQPGAHLGVGSGSQAAQTGDILKKFEDVVTREMPHVVIVVGDVNSTVACALATAKLPVTADKPRPLIAHVEAGLRSFDRLMPEEINRIVTDHLSDILFVTEESGLRNLRREGISSKKIFFVGNTMIDSLLMFKDRADTLLVLKQFELCTGARENGGRETIPPYALLTLHRPSNVDNRETFRRILEGLTELSQQCAIIFPVHPRTRRRIEEFGLVNYFQTNVDKNQKGIRLIDPLGYVEFLCLMKNARLVLTDSGGVQEETTCLRIPCVTIRENTERPVTVTEGTNLIAGTTSEGIRKAIIRQMTLKPRNRTPEKWDGKTAARIVRALERTVRKQQEVSCEP
jgi:UDP-N-acetylglucosamine 2-epimerase (non-hydrolysing)